MKHHVFAAATVIVLGLLGLSSDVKAASCTELADNTARALARQYCEDVKDADVRRVIILPSPQYAAEAHQAPSVLEHSVPFRQCTRTHSLICKQRMADLVGNDRQCRWLFNEGFAFKIENESTAERISTDSRSYYETLQLEGCNLH